MNNATYKIENGVIPDNLVDVLESLNGSPVTVSLRTADSSPLAFFYRGTFVATTGPLGRSYSLRTDNNPYSITLNLQHFPEARVTQHQTLGVQISFSRFGERYMSVDLSRVDPISFMDDNFSIERGWEGEQVGAPQVSNVRIDYVQRPNIQSTTAPQQRIGSNEAALHRDQENGQEAGMAGELTLSQAEVYVGTAYPYSIRASQPNGFTGPFLVESSDARIASAASPSSTGDACAFDVHGHEAGDAIITVRGYESGSATVYVHVTTLSVFAHFKEIDGAATYTVTAGGEWGSGTVASPTAYPTSSTTVVLDCNAVSQVVDANQGVRPLLTTFVQIVVSDDVGIVLEKRVSTSVSVGRANSVSVDIP